jgi:hypothetical protein
MYIPKNQILQDQYTAGKEYITENDKSEYVGFYYVLYNGDKFTGKNPNDGSNNKLLPYSNQNTANSKVYYDLLNQLPVIQEIKQYKAIEDYYPTPTKKDYDNGFIPRYFCQRVHTNAETIIEISKDTFTSMTNKAGIYNDKLYQVTSLNWKISGPLFDNNKNPNHPIPGIIDTNKRTLEQKEKEMPGITLFLSDFSEFFA